MSPEALLENNLSNYSDAYSFGTGISRKKEEIANGSYLLEGVVLWEILTETEPYAHLDAVAAGHAIIQGQKLDIPSWAPAEYAGLLQDCWQTDPPLRPSFDAIYARIEVKR
jgi:hypothetical protein